MESSTTDFTGKQRPALRYIARDFWVGLVMLAVAAVYWFEAGKIRISPLDGPVNASGLPKSLAYALGFLALVLMVRGLIDTHFAIRSGKSGEAAPALAKALRPHLRAMGMLAIGVGYLLTVSWLGYILTIAVLLVAVSLYNGARAGLKVGLFAMSGGVFFHLMFVEFLGIPLPPGLILAPILN